MTARPQVLNGLVEQAFEDGRLAGLREAGCSCSDMVRDRLIPFARKAHLESAAVSFACMRCRLLYAAMGEYPAA